MLWNLCIISISSSYNLHFTCVTGGPGVPRLTVADGLSWLWHTTLPVSAALPPAGWWLLPSITVLTLVAFTALAAVGLTLRHTHTMNTSGVRGRKEGRQVRGDGNVGAAVNMSVYIQTFVPSLYWLCLPAVLTGGRCCRLVTQGPAASWRTITCYPRLSSLSARTLGAHTAGVTPCENALSLVTEQEREKTLSERGCNLTNILM